MRFFNRQRVVLFLGLLGVSGALLGAWALSPPANSPQVIQQFAQGLAVRPDGTLWTWDDNQPDQPPQRVGVDADWAAAATGDGFFLALKSDGSLYAWGANDMGQLGLDPTVFPDVASPTLVGAGWARVAAGFKHTLALKQDGTLWAWGYNRHGQLGLGTLDSPPQPHPTPTQVGADSDWVAVATAGYHSLARRADGTVWAWGDNTSGQAGQALVPGGSRDYITVPTRVGTARDWVAVAAGVFSSFGIRADGSLWAWGNNTYGQLGTGQADPQPNEPPASHPTPQRIGSSSAWIAVSGGEAHGLAVRSDGSLWAWGGSDSAPSAPVRLGTDTDWAATAGESVAWRRSGVLSRWSGDPASPPTDVSGFQTGVDTSPPAAAAMPAPGAYQAPLAVVLLGTDDTTMRPVVRYTTDGTEPGPASPVYAAPLSLGATTTVKFYAEDASGNRSATVSSVYEVTPDSGGGGGGGGACFLRTLTRR